MDEAIKLAQELTEKQQTFMDLVALIEEDPQKLLNLKTIAATRSPEEIEKDIRGFMDAVGGAMGLHAEDTFGWGLD